MGELVTGERGQILNHIFNQYDRLGKGELSSHDVQKLHANIRMGGISYPQVLASMKYVCATQESCTKDELFDLLQEMDRRYFLLQDFRWEFSLLDREQKDTITEDQAKWLVQAVHGSNFSKRKWADFLQKRAVPSNRVAFQEIEVLLCNVKSSLDVLHDREEEEKEMREKLEKQRLAEEEAMQEKERLRKLKAEEKQRREEEKQKQEEAHRRKMMDEEVERRRRQHMEEEEERLKEEERLRELEKKQKFEEEQRRMEEMEKYKDAEELLKKSQLNEKDIEERLRLIREEMKNADDKRRRELEVEEQKMLKLQRESKHIRIRYYLKVAIKERDRYKLEYTINEFKTEKVEDTDMDLDKAERLLKEIVSRDNLRRAMSKREIEELEKAINMIKKHGLEGHFAKELIEANAVLARLRKIQRIRSEILELKQSTVAEIRSYQNPPPVVHTVMTATFLLLGHSEKETKDWKTVQALVGKTGKEGLKRRCLECDATKISLEAAKRAKLLLEKQELDEVRDVSAGAATFYIFSVAMVEECIDLAENGSSEPGTNESNTAGTAQQAKSPKIDPTSMVISRSRQMVTTSKPSQPRSKTPTNSK